MERAPHIGSSAVADEAAAAQHAFGRDAFLREAEVISELGFEVIQRLGVGGMGTVWRVRSNFLHKDRALKFMQTDDQELRERFRVEARAMDKLDHENSVRVYHWLVGDVPYIEMEYVSGRSLDRVIVPEVPMPLKQVAVILKQLCDVLQKAHDEHIIHRDLKPANLMLVDGEISKNRHGRFRESNVFRHVFEGVVRRCMAEGLVRGEGFAIDASVVKADANRQRGVPSTENIDWSSPELGTRAVHEYLQALEQDGQVGVTPSNISLDRSGGALDRSPWRPGILRLLDQLSRRCPRRRDRRCRGHSGISHRRDGGD